MNQLLHLLNVVNALCSVLGMDFKSTICSVHPSLDNACKKKSISADTMQGLSAVILRLKNVKLQRMQKVCLFSSQLSFMYVVFSHIGSIFSFKKLQ